MDHLPRYYRYWGKASDQEDRIEYHLLPYHLLDVASVGCVFLKQNAAIRHKLQGLIQWNSGDEEFLSWITFLLALHDVGKFAESFQNLRSDIFSDLHNRTSCRSYNEKHDSLGWFFWRDVIKKKLQEKKLVSQQKGSHRMQSVKSSIDYWMMAMVGHHGVPPKLFNEHSMSSDFDTKDYEAVNQFLEDVIPILLPQNKPFPQNLGLYQNMLKN